MIARRNRLVVVGNGMAGARFVEDLLTRGGGDQFEVVVFGDEPYGNYNRILLSNVLSRSHEPQDIFLNPLEWYAEHGVELRAGCRVTAIDRRARRVLHGDGATGYDALVVATGSSPFVPRLAGLTEETGEPKEGVFVFRTLDDCRRIMERAGRSRSAVVIGGGLLGLEAARGLQQLGVAEVHVVHLVDHLMETQLDGFGGAILRRMLCDMGFHVHLRRETRALLGKGHVSGVEFSDGSTLDCDMVVIAAGIRPNTALAREAGLAVNRGIVVGDDLRTDDPAIYSIGECSEHRGQTYGLVAPLWEQARVLADRLTGRNPSALYLGSRIATKLKVMGIDLSVMGDHETRAEDEEIRYVEESAGVYKKLLVRGGRLAGAILLGDASRSADLLNLFDRGGPLPERRSELLFPGAGAAADAGGVEALPDDAQICNCNGVSKGQLVAAVGRGCRSLKALCDATRAGLGCGSCTSRVKAVLEHAAGGDLAEDPAVHFYVPGVPLTKAELVAAVRERGLKSVSSVFAAFAEGREDPGSKTGLASLLKTLWGAEYADERDARFINDRVHANVQKDGTFSVVPGISGGVTSSEQLRRIADVADRYGVRMIKITGGQRIDLLGIAKEQLPAVWKDLGMRSGHAYAKAFRTVKTCVGSEFCRFGLGDSTRLGVELEERFKGLESPGKLKLGVAGCPRNCSEALIKDVGVVAVEGGRWEVYVGGAGGAHVRKADLLGVFETHEDVLRVVGRFIQYYRENAKYLERTYGFVPRVGIDRIRAVVVDDAEGIVGRLDEAMEWSIASYRDPWLEADEPVHPSQFTSLLNV